MNDIAHKIKEIEIYAKRLMRINLLGNARAVKKGFGLEFDQLRDYQIGDDVRAVDWKSSARMNKLLIKQFNEDSHRTLLLVIDNSASVWYGSHALLKQELINKIASIISLAGLLAKDAIGLLIVSDQVEVYIPPKKGKIHFNVLLEKIFSFQKSEKTTNLNAAFEQIINTRKKNMMVFVISDFIDEFDKKLSLLSRLHEVIAIRVHDNFELQFPHMGLVTMRDSETGQEKVINTKNMKHNSFNYYLSQRIQEQKIIFARNKIDLLDIHIKQDAISSLIDFFRMRKR